MFWNVSEVDSNIRDYSGKKAKQYLKNSASSKAQRKHGSLSSIEGIDMTNIVIAGPELKTSRSNQNLRLSSVFDSGTASNRTSVRNSVQILHLSMMEFNDSSVS